MAAGGKTMAERILERDGIAYERLDYPPALRDAEEVAAHLGLPPERLFKTLVVRRRDGGMALAMLPSDRRLDLGLVGRALGEKGLSMAGRAEAEAWTGMEAGGISAIPLRGRGAPVLLDEPARRAGSLAVSAGRRGRNLALAAEDLVRATGARLAPIGGPRATDR